MRIKIAITSEQKKLFETSYKIGVSDLNYGNHLGNDRVLLLAHQARVEWLKEIEQSELDFFGQGLIMADSACQYKSQGHLHDEVKIEVFGSLNGKLGFDLFYKMSNITKNTTLAHVKSGMLFFDYQKSKISTLSEESALKFEKLFHE
ncbi:MAG: thioesterase [Oligoflexia bacterium]|nr:thioesterase [Oligoflexia bacterium]